MFKIYTEYEWDEFISSMDHEKQPWYDLKQRYPVVLTPKALFGKHAQIEYWIITECPYDVYCLIFNIKKKELTASEKQIIRNNILAKPPTKTIRNSLFVKQQVILEGDELEEYITAIEEWNLTHTAETAYKFYFLSEADAMAFKLKWS